MLNFMKIAYITPYDATNILNWSGTAYYIAHAFKHQTISLNYINSFQQKSLLRRKVKGYLYKHLVKKKHMGEKEPLSLRFYADQIHRTLSSLNSDIVFSLGTDPIAYLQCDQPIVFWTDTSFAGAIDYIPSCRNLCRETIINGNKAEQSALERCRLAIYSSEWAARIAINHYKIDPSKVKVVPFGANIEIECERTLDDIKSIVQSRPSNQCNLLFLGGEWINKRGDIAIEVARELNRSGLPTVLTLVGCGPIGREPLPDFVRSYGFISKSTEEGLSKIKKLLAESHFLILPSWAECTPIQFCEANAFGVPCLATKVGGVTSVIKDGLNGWTFSRDAHIKEYCSYIFDLFLNYEKYKELAYSSFNEYQNRLNWANAVGEVKRLLENIRYR